MERASASIERPCRAAAMRSFCFTDSSSFRIVNVAIAEKECIMHAMPSSRECMKLVASRRIPGFYPARRGGGGAKGDTRCREA
jgi:hypothetical protein